MFKWIRIPKGAALLAFFLPWMTVSCQGQQMMSGTGLGLAFGSIQSSLPGASDAPMNFWLILVLLALIGGIAATFWDDKRAPLATLVAAGTALVLTWIGTSRYSVSGIAEAAAARDPSVNPMDQAMLAMISVDWHFGFWLASLAMLAATVMAWLVHSGKADEAEKTIRNAVASGAGSIAAAANVSPPPAAPDAEPTAEPEKPDPQP